MTGLPLAIRLRGLVVFKLPGRPNKTAHYGCQTVEVKNSTLSALISGPPPPLNVEGTATPVSEYADAIT